MANLAPLVAQSGALGPNLILAIVVAVLVLFAILYFLLRSGGKQLEEEERPEIEEAERPTEDLLEDREEVDEQVDDYEDMSLAEVKKAKMAKVKSKDEERATAGEATERAKEELGEAAEGEEKEAEEEVEAEEAVDGGEPEPAVAEAEKEAEDEEAEEDEAEEEEEATDEEEGGLGGGLSELSIPSPSELDQKSDEAEEAEEEDEEEAEEEEEPSDEEATEEEGAADEEAAAEEEDEEVEEEKEEEDDEAEKADDDDETGGSGGSEGGAPEGGEEEAAAEEAAAEEEEADEDEEADEQEDEEEGEERADVAEDVLPEDIDDEEAEPKSLEKGLEQTREGFIDRLSGFFTGEELDENIVEDVEEVLFSADIGPRVAQDILDAIEEQLSGEDLEDPGKIWGFIRHYTTELLKTHEEKLDTSADKPYVVLVVGVNGVGKTTTIGKMASRFHREGKSVLLVAGDTFRAAAVDQLGIWAERTGLPMHKGEEGADPASVIYSGIERAMEEDIDVVLCDTSGRLHTDVNLMDELEKMERVAGKAKEGAPHEVNLVLDANTGQNAIAQAEKFDESLDLTGFTLTKFDGTARGGVILGVCKEFDAPVRYVGIGERVVDLREFDAEEFVEALFM